MSFYESATVMTKLYCKLQDDISKGLFWSRLKYETKSDMDSLLDLIASSHTVNPKAIQRVKHFRSVFSHIESINGRIVLYGAGTYGILYAENLIRSGRDFYCFCDKNHAGEKLIGKDVISPEQLIDRRDDFYVFITAKHSYEEIKNMLLSHGMQPNHIVEDCGILTNLRDDIPRMYFEFENLIPSHGAFIDAGCYNGDDSLYFRKNLERGGIILAFEPDAMNYKRCVKKFEEEDIDNINLLDKALGDSQKEGFLEAFGGTGSYLSSCHPENDSINRRKPSQKQRVAIVRLDEEVDCNIGMIKMDIEGAEFDALHGAEKIISRDKPFLAISVYHRKGDMLSIMEYIDSIVPEYNFWLRHYTATDNDTVLYASV